MEAGIDCALQVTRTEDKLDACPGAIQEIARPNETYLRIDRREDLGSGRLARDDARTSFRGLLRPKRRAGRCGGVARSYPRCRGI